VSIDIEPFLSNQAGYNDVLRSLKPYIACCIDLRVLNRTSAQLARVMTTTTNKAHGFPIAY